MYSRVSFMKEKNVYRNFKTLNNAFPVLFDVSYQDDIYKQSRPWVRHFWNIFGILVFRHSYKLTGLSVADLKIFLVARSSYFCTYFYTTYNKRGRGG